MGQEAPTTESKAVATSEGVARSRIQINWKRLINWLIFSVGFSLLPLLFAWFFRALLSRQTTDTINDYPEIIFFAVVICATTVAEIRGVQKPKRWENYFFLLESLLILGSVGLAVCYGGVRLVSIADPSLPLQPQVLRYSIYSAIIFCVFSATAQFMLATAVEGQK
jgi:hypothetical protein